MIITSHLLRKFYITVASKCNLLAIIIFTHTSLKGWQVLARTWRVRLWILASYPLSEFVAAVLYGTFINHLPATIIIISYTILYVAGGIVYALAEHVWMVLVGISLHGAATAFNVLTLLTYMGQMGEVMDDVRKKEGKRPLKFLMYCGVTLTFSGGFIIPFGRNLSISDRI